MAKEKRKLINKIVDLGAKIITGHDNLQIKADEALKKAGHKIVDGMAAVITGHDLLQLYIDRGCFLVQYHVAHFIHLRRRSVAQHKKEILGYFAGAILVAIGIVAMFNYATAYEYSYNGRALGYVKNQDEVIKILDVASVELTKEYGTQINIDPENDISFRRVVSLDREIDNVDTVLRKFTYMSDMLTEGYGIYIDGQLYSILSSEAQAEQVLTTLQAAYTPEKDQTRYEKIGFKEEVEIEPINVKLARISSVARAVETISTGAQAETVYVVKSGDTYYEICEAYDKTMDELKANNPDLNENELYAGQEIVITSSVSALTVVTVEESTFAEVVEYKTEYRDSADMYEGDSTVTQAGQNGRRVVTAKITRENGVETNRDVLASETITQDVTEIITRGTAERPRTAPTGSFSTPIRAGYVLSSPYGWRWGRMHNGIDMACATGTPIYAADGGTVTYSGWYSGYGMYIEISHGSGRVTRYGHCSALHVSAGEQVYKGQRIGSVGNTGNSTGSHLHFEILIGGSTVNPLSYI